MAHERYVVVEGGSPESEKFTDKWGEGYDNDILVDTQRDEVVYHDYYGDDPEDMYLGRNLSRFVTELNRLAEELRLYKEEEVPWKLPRQI